MESLARELISYGVNGRVLSQVSEDVMNRARDSNIAEVNSILDLPLLAQNYIRNDIKNHINEDIDRPDQYVIRLSSGEWCRLVLKSKIKWGPHYYLLTSLLVTHPDGISNEEISKELNTNTKQSLRWLRTLREEGLATCKAIGDKKIYVYNFDVFDTWDVALFGISLVETPATKRKNPENSGNRNNNSMKHKKGLPSGHNVAELAREIFKMMKSENSPVISVVDLSKYLQLHYTDALPDRIISILEEERYIKTKLNADGGEVIVPLALEDVAGQIVEFGHMKRIMRLSESKEEISRILPLAFERGDGGVVDLFEANGFNIVEVRSKYLPADFIIVDSDISENDDEFIAILCDVKASTSKQFREKVWKVFFKNNEFDKYDNGFNPSARERVEFFYTFILDKLRALDYKLVFDQDVVFEMNFLTFLSCVSLSRSDLLYTVAIECAKRSKKHAFIQDLGRLATLQSDFDAAAYAEMLEKSRAYLSKYSCGDILRLSIRNRSINEYLHSKMTVSAFCELFDLIVHYGLFQRSEKNSTYYFRMNEGEELSITAAYEKISRNMRCKGIDSVTLEDRCAFYNAVIKSDQEEFCSTAEEYLRSVNNSDVAEYFITKLRAFI